MARLLIIGLGSIGARHARVARELGHDLTIVSRRPAAEFESFTSVDAAMKTGPEFAIIATETSAHMAAFEQLRTAGFEGPVLIEKPMLNSPEDLEHVTAGPTHNVRIAYNLRFHPALQLLRDRVRDQPCINAIAYAGQDLRQWRAGRSIETTYSGKASLGGGVLRDLSHELDYLRWIFGSGELLAAVGGQIGPLPIESDDCWTICQSTVRCRQISLTIDYYCRQPRRTVLVNLENETIVVDLVEGSLTDSSGKVTWDVQRDDTYRRQLEAFVRGDPKGVLADWDDGLAIGRLIATIEAAVGRGNG